MYKPATCNFAAESLSRYTKQLALYELEESADMLSIEEKDLEGLQPFLTDV